VARDREVVADEARLSLAQLRSALKRAGRRRRIDTEVERIRSVLRGEKARRAESADVRRHGCGLGGGFGRRVQERSARLRPLPGPFALVSLHG
jgi:hypothetical protein